MMAMVVMGLDQLRLKSYALSSFFYIILANSVLIIGSKLYIPLYPVPMTLQTFAIVMVALYTPRCVSMTAMLMYLLEGGLGFPVFADSRAGWQILFGSNLGYFVGFIGLSYVCSSTYLQNLTTNRSVNLLMLQCIGYVVLFSCGVICLAFYIGFATAMQYGFYPFICGCVCKMGMIIYLEHICPHQHIKSKLW